jgi:hypothetical protein
MYIRSVAQGIFFSDCRLHVVDWSFRTPTSSSQTSTPSVREKLIVTRSQIKRCIDNTYPGARRLGDCVRRGGMRCSVFRRLMRAWLLGVQWLQWLCSVIRIPCLVGPMFKVRDLKMNSPRR